MIASTARSYLVVEKMAMGDGRYDSARLIEAIERHSQAHVLLDMEALARQAGPRQRGHARDARRLRRLPIAQETLEAAIRADGKAVDANLERLAPASTAARRSQD